MAEISSEVMMNSNLSPLGAFLARKRIDLAFGQNTKVVDLFDTVAWAPTAYFSDFSTI
jgi:hypothetical protein